MREVLDQHVAFDSAVNSLVIKRIALNLAGKYQPEARGKGIHSIRLAFGLIIQQAICSANET